MTEFTNFILKKVYNSTPIPQTIIDAAFSKVVLDVNYHFPDLSPTTIRHRIETNNSELALFLFRLGKELKIMNQENLIYQIHWLLKELCSCEIYFNNEIGEGFYIVHGEGSVIGSRNNIGKGFKLYQGCTIGHKYHSQNGADIGNNVTLYSNSAIIGDH